MSTMKTRAAILVSGLMLQIWLLSPVYALDKLTLERAITLAANNDHRSSQLQQLEMSAQEMSKSSGQLPDPVIKIGAKNLPTDTFSFDQEPMTQFSIGISQQFPPGDSLLFKQEINALEAGVWSAKENLRKLEVRKLTRQSWFETYYWQNAIRVLETDKVLFQQLLQITHSLYSVGKKQQQDVLGAELEISRLHERIIQAHENLQLSKLQLARWTGDTNSMVSVSDRYEPIVAPFSMQPSPNELSQILVRHPLLQQMDKKVEQSKKSVELAEQSYKPRWGIDAAYGYRDGENFDGSERADFFSVMVNVDMPIFVDKRQDKSVSSKRYARAAQQAGYLDLLREQTIALLTQYEKWKQLKLRRQLYEESMLSQSTSQTKATLNAYQSDATDFSELMRAYLGNQRTQLDYQRLIANEQQILAELHFLYGSEYPVPGV